MAEIALRPYRPAEDTEAVVGLHRELNRHEAALGAARDTSLAAARACLAEDGAKVRDMGGEQIVAVADGKVVGYAALLINRSGAFVPEDLRDHVHIENLVVDLAYRRRGIASRLLAQADNLARLHNFGVVTLGVVVGNTGAETAYRRAGFAPIAIEMAKRLD